MHILTQTGRDDLALAYVAEMGPGQWIEFVESLQPPLSRDEKWVLIVSSLFGCPAACPMCDAGGYYAGPLSLEQLRAQVDYLIERRYPDRRVPAGKFKIQFARMGEPALNPAVLDLLGELPERYDAPGLLPALSTTAPHGSQAFFARLRDVKNRHYSGGRFQLQFSIHSTDEAVRDRLIPVRKWTLAEIASYGHTFRRPGDRKITLNFALARDVPLDPGVLLRYFDPGQFLIKITPLNPTHRAARHGLASHVDPYRGPADDPILHALRAAGYEVLLSIGEVGENRIGSNCGQYLLTHLRSGQRLGEGYADVHPSAYETARRIGIAAGGESTPSPPAAPAPIGSCPPGREPRRPCRAESARGRSSPPPRTARHGRRSP